MKMDWKREIVTWVQYFLFLVVAATAALLFRAASNFDRMHEPSDDMAVDFTYANVLKGSAEYYSWLLGIFIGLSAARFFILYISSRSWRRMS